MGTNVAGMVGIDLGSKFNVLFADRDLVIDGFVDEFVWAEVKELLSKMDLGGWRLPKGLYEINDMFCSGGYPHIWNKSLDVEWVDGEYCKVMSNENGNALKFHCMGDGVSYWSYWGDDDTICDDNSAHTARGFNVCKPQYQCGGCVIMARNHNQEELCRIRLVKDKE